MVKENTIRLTVVKEYADQSNADYLYVDYLNIIKVVKPGNVIYIDDGLISVRVKQISEYSINSNYYNFNSFITYVNSFRYFANFMYNCSWKISNTITLFVFIAHSGKSSINIQELEKN